VNFLYRFGAFWYDFIVGDDWTVAVGVVIALAMTALLSQMHIVGWIWLPLAVMVLLGSYAWRVSKT
jgi:hypothetical protein